MLHDFHRKPITSAPAKRVASIRTMSQLRYKKVNKEAQALRFLFTMAWGREERAIKRLSSALSKWWQWKPLEYEVVPLSMYKAGARTRFWPPTKLRWRNFVKGEIWGWRQEPFSWGHEPKSQTRSFVGGDANQSNAWIKISCLLSRAELLCVAFDWREMGRFIGIGYFSPSLYIVPLLAYPHYRIIQKKLYRAPKSIWTIIHNCPSDPRFLIYQPTWLFVYWVCLW